MASVMVELRPETAQKLSERAGLTGETLERYLSRLAEDDAAGRRPVRHKTFADAAAPVAEAVQASGKSDEEVERIFDDALREVRAERRARRQPE